MLTVDYWNKVYIEYETENDKVDIAFELEDELIKVIQVKSSVNLFTKSNITKWLIELINDSESEEYNLMLIGSVNDSANKFIKSLVKKENKHLNQEAKKSLKGLPQVIVDNRVSVTLIPFNEKILQSIVKDNLYNYISFKGAIVDYEGLEMLSNSINMTMMVLSSNGNGITKKDLDKKIFNWLKTVMSSYMTITDKKAKHIVGIYDDSLKKIVSKSIFKTINNMDKMIKLTNHYKEAALELVNKLNNIVLEKSSVIEELERNNFRKSKSKEDEYKLSKFSDFVKAGSTLIDSLNSNMNFQNVEYSYEEKMKYVEMLDKIFGIKSDESIFYLDNLKKSTNNFISKSNPHMIGSAEAKNKYDLIIELIYILYKGLCLKELKNDFGELNIFKIGVKNIGYNYDSDIRVQMFIPIKIGLYDFKNYTGNDFIPLLSDVFIEEDGLLDQLFTIESDTNLKIEKNSAPIIKKSDIPLSTIGYPNRKEYTLDDFNREISEYFMTNIIDRTSKYTVLEFNINELCQNEVRGSDKYLLLNEYDKETIIKYKIYSRNSNGDIEGIITIDKLN